MDDQKKDDPKNYRASQSFSDGEVQILDFVCTNILRGGDVKMAVRHKDFPSLLRKVVAMKQKVDAKRVAINQAALDAKKAGLG